MLRLPSGRMGWDRSSGNCLVASGAIWPICHCNSSTIRIYFACKYSRHCFQMCLWPVYSVCDLTYLQLFAITFPTLGHKQGRKYSFLRCICRASCFISNCFSRDCSLRAVILQNCFCSQLWFYIFYLCNLFRKVIYWRRRHVGSGSYKEGCCREKERGWQIWWSRVEIWSEIDITPGNWSIGMMPFG